jgi:hypothetical protein
VILARPEVARATDVFALLGAPWGAGRAVARAAIPHMTVAALDSEIAADLAACDIADDPATDEADRSRNDGPSDGSHGRTRYLIVRARCRGRDDNCGRDRFVSMSGRAATGRNGRHDVVARPGTCVGPREAVHARQADAE